MKALAGFALAAAATALPATALAQFAEPPGDEPILVEDDRPVIADDRHSSFPERFELPPPRSTVRLLVGPALQVAEEDANGGLFAAMDVGRAGAGLRLSGLWVGTGSEGGLSQYGAELWLDFAHDKRLHPIVGAGGALALVDVVDDAGNPETVTVGVGTLRAGLQYQLPVRGTDARASLDVIGALPAIRDRDDPKVDPWVTIVAGVGVGF